MSLLLPLPRTALRWLFLAAAIGALGVHAGYYHPFFSDDALISLRYARRFAQGLGLTWTDGERVEGYTDLLWVLLNAPSTWLHLDPLGWARALDFIGGALAVWAVSAGSGRTPEPWRLATGGLLVALGAPIAVWSQAGLEHGLMFGLLGWCLVLAMRGFEPRPGAQRDLLAASALGAALVLLRADGMVLVGAAGLGFVLAQPGRDGLRRTMFFGMIPAAALGGQLLFRRGYYGTWVPNTALAKVSFNLQRLGQGLGHVRDGLLPLAVLVLAAALAVVVLIRAGAPRRRWLPPLTVTVLWCAYLAAVGGDIFPGWRQLALALVPLALLVAEAAGVLAARLTRRAPVAALVWAAALGGYLFLQGRDSENIRAKHERWEWGGLPIGTALKTAFGPARPLLAVDAAGALPFWSDLPSLDMLGLNDWYIPRHPPPYFGRGAIGHELGDGAYVLRRAPDIVAFCGAVGNREPCFESGRQMLDDFTFHSGYQLVLVQHQGTHGQFYLRREGPIGVRRTDAEVSLPGYLFAGDEPNRAILRGQTFVTPLRPDAPATGVLRMEPGVWSVAISPAAPATIRFACAENSARHTAGPPDTLALSRPMDVRIAVGVGQSLLLERVTLRRLTGGAAGWTCADDDRTPVIVDLADLAQPRKEHDLREAPGNILFGRDGVRVLLLGTVKAARIGLSVDSNDRYALHYRRLGTVVAVQELHIRPGEGGMAVWDLETPNEVALAGADEIEVKPDGGDGQYSLGHLFLR